MISNNDNLRNRDRQLDKVQLRIQRAEAALNAGYYEEAYEMFQQATAVPGDYPDRSNDIRSMIKNHCDQLIDQDDPKWSQSNLILGWFHQFKLNNVETEGWVRENRLKQAEHYLKDGKIEESFDIFAQLLAEEVQESELLFHPRGKISNIVREYVSPFNAQTEWEVRRQAIAGLQTLFSEDTLPNNWLETVSQLLGMASDKDQKIDELITKVDDLQKTFDNTTRNHEKTIDQQKQRIADLENEKKSADKAQKVLENDLRSKEKEIEHQTKTNAEMKIELDKEKEKSATFSLERDKLELQLEGQIANKDRQIEQLENDLDNANESLERAKADMDQLNQTLEDRDKQLHQRQQELNQEKGRLKDAGQDYKKLNSELNALRDDLNEKDQTSKQQRETIKKLELELDQITQERNQHKNDLTETRETLENIKNTRQELQLKVDGQTKELTTTRRRYEELRTELKSLREDINLKDKKIQNQKLWAIGLSALIILGMLMLIGAVIYFTLF